MESGLPDLEMRRNSRVLKIGGRIQERGRSALLEVASSLSGYNKTFGSRFQGLLVSMDFHQSHPIRENRIKQIPQWAFQQLNMDISLTRMTKADTCSEKIHQEALSVLKKYDSVVYTDGSKMGEAVGNSIVNEN
jgi:hypothetical protein